VLAARCHHAVDGLEEQRMVELARDAERSRQVEMTHPQAVDTVNSSDCVGVLGAGGCLNLCEKADPLVGSLEPFSDDPS
jgi:hypothetical protein